jgi:hypothetical protein
MTRLAAGALALALASLLALALMPARAAALPGYTRETFSEYERQLAAHEVASAIIDKRLARLDVTLRDGRHVFAKYPKKGAATALSQLHARHVQVTVMNHAEESKEASEVAIHHKWRYIIGGVLIALVVLIAAFVLYRRRRVAALE